MKRFLFLVLSFTTFYGAIYAQDYQTRFSQERKLDCFKTNDAVYQTIVFSSAALTDLKGWAELPFINTSIQLSANKYVNLSVEYTDFRDITLDYPLLPSRGSINRNQDPTTIPYVIDPASYIDAFYPGYEAIAETPYIIRDVRGTTVSVFPFQWNAVTKTLRIYTQLTVTLTENNEPATNPLLRENPNPIREVRGMYRSIFINYQEPRLPLTMAEFGDILVITTARDEAAVQPYIDWKMEKGYNVDKEVVATGYSAVQTKGLIQAKYSANPNLMYVLLVGDWADIKSDVYTGVIS